MSLRSFKFIFSAVPPQHHAVILLPPVFRGGNQDAERFRSLPKATQLGRKVDLKSGLAASQVQPLFLSLSNYFYVLYSVSFQKPQKWQGSLQPATRQRYAKDGESSSLFPFPHRLTVNTRAVPSTASVLTQTQANGELILESSLFSPNGMPLHMSLCSLLFLL